MRIDVKKSKYHEADHAVKEFKKHELKLLRVILRRLRFLEQQIRESGGLANGSANGGALYAEMEVDGLAFILTEIGYLDDVIGEDE